MGDCLGGQRAAHWAVLRLRNVPCACDDPTVAGVPGVARMEVASAWKVASVVPEMVRRVWELGKLVGEGHGEQTGVTGVILRWDSEVGNGPGVWGRWCSDALSEAVSSAVRANMWTSWGILGLPVLPPGG